jgi:hypothetical protein
MKVDSFDVNAALQDPVMGSIFGFLRYFGNKSEEEFHLFDDQIIKLYLIYLKSNSNPNSNWKPFLGILVFKLILTFSLIPYQRYSSKTI